VTSFIVVVNLIGPATLAATRVQPVVDDAGQATDARAQMS
jgi:hypothetical protein